LFPGSLLGVVFLAAAICPGYWWVRATEQRKPRQDRSPLLEAAELFSVGGLFSAIWIIAVFLIGDHFNWIDVPAIVRDSRAYVAAHPARAMLAAFLAVVGANVAAWGLARIWNWRRPANLRLGVSALHEMVGHSPSQTRPYLTVDFVDGSSLAGWFMACTVQPALPEEQEIVLAGTATVPIQVRTRAQRSYSPIKDQFVILNGASVRAIYGRYPLFGE
jgi:hypothetical protein